MRHSAIFTNPLFPPKSKQTADGRVVGAFVPNG
jgi:hypothetical protein